jgi:hypothetical protein
VQELFHGGDSDDKGSTTSESFFSFVWRFHLSPAARLPDAADHMGLDLVGYTKKAISIQRNCRSKGPCNSYMMMN